MFLMSHRSPKSHPASRRGFTLVEMLVVIGIIAVLAALLLPAVMYAVNAARRAAIVLEVNQLNDAIEAYKKDKGDYPPNFRDPQAFIRHVRRCYPKIAQSEIDYFFTYNSATGVYTPTIYVMDEGECLVFWLSKLRNDPRYPFGATGGANSPYKKYYEFDAQRLVSADSGTVDLNQSYRAKYSRDTFYVYIDSRSYDELVDFTTAGALPAFAEDSSVPENCVRPYWSENLNPANTSTTAANSVKFLPMNPTTFQILCAGLDGHFGYHDSSDPKPDTDVKFFPGGTNYQDEDNDNITNFSGGRLADKIP